jgi:hypothetical protein
MKAAPWEFTAGGAAFLSHVSLIDTGTMRFHAEIVAKAI